MARLLDPSLHLRGNPLGVLQGPLWIERDHRGAGTGLRCAKYWSETSLRGAFALLHYVLIHKLTED